MGVVRATVISLCFLSSCVRCGVPACANLGSGWPMAAFRRPSVWCGGGPGGSRCDGACLCACGLSGPAPTVLPAVVREGLVGFGHAVGFLALLDGAAAVLGSVDQLAGELARHRVLAALAGRLDQPAHRQRHAPRSAYFDRHLVGGAADAT